MKRRIVMIEPREVNMKTVDRIIDEKDEIISNLYDEIQELEKYKKCLKLMLESETDIKFKNTAGEKAKTIFVEILQSNKLYKWDEIKGKYV
jgi:hypothetical protein